MPVAEIEGRHVAYDVTGEAGPWLTIVHGGLVGAATWRRQADRLGRVCRVLTYDLRGYGLSDAGDEDFTFADLAGDLLALWDATGIRRSHVLGFSAGGCVAIEVAAAAPDRVAGLVLESTTAQADEATAAAFLARAAAVERDGVAADAGEHVHLAFSAAFRAAQPEIVDEYTAVVERADARTLARTFRALAAFDGRDAVAALDCPVLVLSGDEDRGMHTGYARELAGLAPDGRLLVLRGTGHTVHVETPAKFTHLVTDFVVSTAESIDVTRKRERAAS